MAGAWQRHPRYSLFIFVVIFSTFYLFYPTPSEPVFKPIYLLRENNLESRIARADQAYEKILKSRQSLIKKFGPTPKGVSLFPPDKSPWPAYTVWDFFPPAYNCPHEVERLGALGDGGKWVCGLSRLAEKEDCIIYSFGNNYESSLEAELLDNTRHCKIWGYDFRTRSFGSEISKSQVSRTHFRPFGLSGTDQHGPGDKPPMYTLETLMKLNGHTHIDILKIDIEGWEFEALTMFLNPYVSSDKPLPIGQLLLEIHIWNKTFAEFLAWWETLEAAGLRPFWAEPNLVYQNYNKQGTTDLAEYSFLNVNGDNVFIKEARRLPGSAEGLHNDNTKVGRD